MRELSLTIEPVAGGFHPLDEGLAASDRITRVVISHLNRLADGTGIILYHLRGESAAIDSILDDTPAILSYELSEARDGFHLYSHFEATGLARQLLAMTQRYELILDLPIECIRGGGIRLSVIGTDANIQDAVSNAPTEIHLELEHIGEFEPSTHREPNLTDRQREVLQTAIEAGYYRVPREVSREELAEELDISGGTVSEHLRKIEAKLVFYYSTQERH